MTHYVAICGPAQHGKDTIAQIFVEEFGYFRLAFADKLREIALAIDPMVGYTDCGISVFVRLSKMVKDVGWDTAKQYPDVRRFLQRLGTEAGREIIGDNIWIDLHEKYASQHQRVIVPDMRFPNEGKHMQNKNAVMINIERPNFDNGVGTGHASEQHYGALKAMCHYHLVNDGTVQDLHEKVRKIAREIEAHGEFSPVQ